MPHAGTNGLTCIFRREPSRITPDPKLLHDLQEIARDPIQHQRAERIAVEALAAVAGINGVDLRFQVSYRAGIARAENVESSIRFASNVVTVIAQPQLGGRHGA